MTGLKIASLALLGLAVVLVSIGAALGFSGRSSGDRIAAAGIATLVVAFTVSCIYLGTSHPATPESCPLGHYQPSQDHSTLTWDCTPGDDQ